MARGVELHPVNTIMAPRPVSYRNLNHAYPFGRKLVFHVPKSAELIFNMLEGMMKHDPVPGTFNFGERNLAAICAFL